MNSVAIEIRGLTKKFKDVEVLKGIDLSVERGTMLALLGPNGAGKTTTVKILSTLLKADGGDAIVDGHSVQKDADKVRSVIGLTGQYAAVDEYLTGRQNLEMMGQLYHLGAARSAQRAQELLEQFGLIDAAERDAKTYSGGMRRRLDLALSLVATPPILFLDEPTTGLDPRSRIAMWDVIEKLMQSGTTILLTTQYLEEADRLADKIAVIDGGRVIAHGTADELKKQVGDERVELVIAPESDFDKALSLIQGEGMKHDKEERSISVSTDGSVRAIKNILDALAESNIELDSMSVHKPTLDDVFLRLTGHEVTKEEPVL
jgi:ABC-2 type transport system ATP-binding protein